MQKLFTSDLKLGIISGGQLGKMLIQQASKWDIISYIMDKDQACPAGSIASVYIQGDNQDFDAVYRFGKMVDVLTYEIENINIAALKKLEAEGVNIAPSPEILELIQDRGRQKEFYRKQGIPSSSFKKYGTSKAIRTAVQSGEIRFPFVQKLRKGGYDGRGVVVVHDETDMDLLLDGASIIEDKIQVEKEISVIAARNRNGGIKCYPVVEMDFDPKANLVDKLICPAVITQTQSREAITMASKIIRLLGMEGILAIEFFINKAGDVLVNEMAPRPHNSGHHSIESIITSQYEQHLRAILNLPLGSTMIKLPSVMINILGDQEHEGPVMYEGIAESMGIEGVSVHLYGKKVTRPYRKMGHATIVSSTLESALQKAEKVKQLIKVVSWEKH